MAEVPVNQPVPCGYDEQFVDPPDEDPAMHNMLFTIERTSYYEMWSQVLPAMSGGTLSEVLIV